MRLQLIFILAMALILVVFTFQNPFPVQMKFMGWQTGQIPLIIIVLISLLVGLVVSLLLGIRQTSELKKTNRRLARKLEDLKIPGKISGGDEL